MPGTNAEAASAAAAAAAAGGGGSSEGGILNADDNFLRKVEVDIAIPKMYEWGDGRGGVGGGVLVGVGCGWVRERGPDSLPLSHCRTSQWLLLLLLRWPRVSSLHRCG